MKAASMAVEFVKNYSLEYGQYHIDDIHKVFGQAAIAFNKSQLKQLSKEYDLNISIMLLMNHRDSFQKSQVGYAETQKAIDTLTELQQKLKS